MTEPKTYRIRTLEDAHAIPEESIDNFLVDLGIYLKTNKKVEPVFADLEKLGVGVGASMGIIWIDDGKHEQGWQIINGDGL